MKRMDSAKSIWTVCAVTLLFILILPACRELQSGPDRNQAPNTILTSAPPETVNATYKVHLYWRGEDRDGTVERFMWYKSDSVMTLRPEDNPDAELLDWNPDARKSDYLKGRFTTKTDSVFVFTGYDDEVGALENKQAFHIAAVDDGGVIDPSPARLQFSARVKGLPEVEYWLERNGEVVPYNPQELDTISMFKNFKVGFRATTPNGAINGYQWSYGDTVYPDTNRDNRPEWFEDLEYEDGAVKIKWIEFDNDNIRDGRRVNYVPSGTFFFMGIARDEAGAISKSNVVTGEGICKMVINHDPETWIMRDRSAFYRYVDRGGDSVTVFVNLKDDQPDTIPYRALLTIRYAGADYPYDILQYTGWRRIPIRYQFMYERFGDRGGRKVEPWYPLTGAEDTNCHGAMDSTTMAVGSFDYIFRVRAFDEQYKSDGTPDSVTFVGNYPPHLDSVQVGFWKPGYWDPSQGEWSQRVFHNIESDTFYIGWTDGDDNSFIRNKYDRGDTLYIDDSYIDSSSDPPLFVRIYRFVLRSVGADHPKDVAITYDDRTKAGIKGWRFSIDDQDTSILYSREGEAIFDSPTYEPGIYENDLLEHELNFAIKVPITEMVSRNIVNNPPKLFGEKDITVIGLDIHKSEPFNERIRGISPEFYEDDSCTMKPGMNGDWIGVPSTITSFARRDTLSKKIYFKLVY